MSRIIVAFTGLAGAGKSTAALRLVDRHGYTRVKFADPLKNMLRTFGMSEREIEGDLKERPCKLFDGEATPREAMQHLGTKWGRELCKNIWINAWRAKVDDLPEVIPVIADDCRFPNEAEAIVAARGFIVHIERPGAATTESKHESEAHDLPRHCTIVNDGEISALHLAIDALHADLAWAQAA